MPVTFLSNLALRPTSLFDVTATGAGQGNIAHAALASSARMTLSRRPPPPCGSWLGTARFYATLPDPPSACTTPAARAACRSSACCAASKPTTEL